MSTENLFFTLYAKHFVLKKYKDYGVTMMEEHKDERMLVTP